MQKNLTERSIFWTLSLSTTTRPPELLRTSRACSGTLRNAATSYINGAPPNHAIITQPRVATTSQRTKVKSYQKTMSLIPLLFSSDPLEDLVRPSRLLQQQFGLGLDPEDLFAPVTAPDLRSLARSCPYFRPWLSRAAEADAGSTVKLDKEKMEISLDVGQFAPEEVSVKAGGGFVTVEGKHEEKQDEHGFISRHFVRRYRLPKGHDVEKIESKMSSDGVLTITAPRVDVKAVEQREVPVVSTGKPAKEKKGEEKEGKEEKMEIK